MPSKFNDYRWYDEGDFVVVGDGTGGEPLAVGVPKEPGPRGSTLAQGLDETGKDGPTPDPRRFLPEPSHDWRDEDGKCLGCLWIKLQRDVNDAKAQEARDAT